MTDLELQQLTEQLSLECFHKPFRHQAIFNSRLRTTGGRYKLSDHSIEINPLVYQLHGTEELTGVIKHELCHYHLHLEGKGYQHRDQDFRELLKRTNSPRFCKPLAEPQKRKSQTTHLYKCQACASEYRRKKRMDPTKYRCGKCRGQIIKIG